jgi:hypothetical protein
MLAEEKLAEKVVMTMALKGAKKIFAANAADKSAEKIVELLKEIGRLDLNELSRYLSRGIRIDKSFLRIVPYKTVTIKFES